jgi:hypothetical protein
MEKKEQKIVKAIAKKPALYEAENEEKLEPQVDLPTPDNVKQEAKETKTPRRGRPANSVIAKKPAQLKTAVTKPVVKRTYKKRSVGDVTLNDKQKSEKAETAAQKNLDVKQDSTFDRNVLLESSMNQANLEISNLQKVHNELKKNVLKLEKKIKSQKEKNKKELEKEKEKLKKNKKKANQKLNNAKLKAKKIKIKKNKK